MSFWILVLLVSLAGLLWSSCSRKLPPGPMGLPVIGNLHMLRDLPHRSLHRLSKKYGSIMFIRLGLVPAVVVSSPQAAELFLKTYDEVFASRANAQAVECLFYGNNSLVFLHYGPYWRNIRKICTLELLTNLKVEYFSPMRKEEVSNLVKSLRVTAKAQTVVDLSFMVQSLMEDMTFLMLFGSKDDRFDFKPVVQETLRLTGTFNVADYGLNHRFKTTSKVLGKYLEEIIEEHVRDARETRATKNTVFIQVMLSLMESQKHGLDRENVKAIMVDMLAAAMDTSSTVIEWAFSELMRHPRVMNRVQEELQNVVGNRLVDETDFSKLSYLDMVVKETLRLHPASPLTVPHESTEEIMIDGYLIPKKSKILINIFAIGRDPNAWSENTEAFYPERFIGTNIDLRGREFQLIPFGSGRRSCPGIQMGLTVVRLVLAQLLHCFNWELPEGTFPKNLYMSERFGQTVPRANHLVLIPTSRNAVNE
ncbi:hypothetical protein GIB67_013428 [Kingdonia uniflora]|uniref:Cytochrome P450 n=1 Tax=Kingdonia uniflora TaxID=39325 RepID=A0A7J7LR27_9MAGN|nr:hypothetical protein GIB67_013428 [Kingdonia uniflora]